MTRRIRLRRLSPDQVYMPFGRHKGRRVSDVSDDYTRWCLCNLDAINPTVERAMWQWLWRWQGGTE